MLKLHLFRFLMLFASLIFMNSCSKEQQSIPDVYVNFMVNPSSAQYSNLNPVGGWVYVTGGYRGILLYHLSPDEFLAYDRACPYDYQKATAQIQVEASGITVVDSTCGSKFIILDGSPFAGPAKNSLKQYRTSYEGGQVYVFN